MPSVKQLSDAAAAAIPDDLTPLFQNIRVLTAKAHGEGRDSYEDWYFVSDEIWQHLDRNFENPGLIPTIESIREIFGGQDDSMLAGHARTLCDIITRAVCERLLGNNADVGAAFDGLDAEIRRRDTNISIFSLNHDLLLERFLRSKKLQFYDCFQNHAETDSFRTFQFSRDVFNEAPLSVIKLHGSVNWRRYRPRNSRAVEDKWRDEFFGIRLREDRDFEEMDDVPLVLLGTFNKLLQYSTPVFLQMFSELHHYLQATSDLLVCGYGFGDKGINTLLAYWMSGKEPRRMTVVSPHPFDPDRCRGAILGKVGIWENEGRLRTLPRKIGRDEARWAEIFKLVGR